jgi:hypothetical protein
VPGSADDPSDEIAVELSPNRLQPDFGDEMRLCPYGRFTAPNTKNWHTWNFRALSS